MHRGLCVKKSGGRKRGGIDGGWRDLLPGISEEVDGCLWNGRIWLGDWGWLTMGKKGKGTDGKSVGRAVGEMVD